MVVVEAVRMEPDITLHTLESGSPLAVGMATPSALVRWDNEVTHSIFPQAVPGLGSNPDSNVGLLQPLGAVSGECLHDDLAQEAEVGDGGVSAGPVEPPCLDRCDGHTPRPDRPPPLRSGHSHMMSNMI